ncbi:MAG: hypothetical protein H6707_06225 [Deltaproteobacteria bacterium]|nr:hypothetical protein [Deltaproteobacteria bacterium]
MLRSLLVGEHGSRWTRVIAVLAISVPIILACNTRSVGEESGNQFQQSEIFPQTPEKDVDLLFVIDNSFSMGREQGNLKNNFPKLIDALRSESLGPSKECLATGNPDQCCNKGNVSGCAIPNVHIGVVSTDLGVGPYTQIENCGRPGGDGGILQNKPREPGCTGPKDAFVKYIEGVTNVPNADANKPIDAVKSAFQCIARLGTNGCGFEHTLESARLALTKGKNPGFVRDEALLAIVFITDEDDCSASDPQLFNPQQSLLQTLGPLTSFRCFEFGVTCDINNRNQIGPRKNCVPTPEGKSSLHAIESYVSFFKSLKTRPGRVLISAITGPTDSVQVNIEDSNPTLVPSCRSADSEAAPAIRIKALSDAFAPDSTFSTICTDDFGPALAALGRKIVGKLGGQCIQQPLLTQKGGVACQNGDTFGNGKACTANCLEDVSCQVTEVVNSGTANESSVTIPKCPSNLWYPADWEKDRDCGTSCPCWRIVKKSSACKPDTDNSTPYGLDILRSKEPAQGTVANMACRGSKTNWTDPALAQTFDACASQDQAGN